MTYKYISPFTLHSARGANFIFLHCTDFGVSWFKLDAREVGALVQGTLEAGPAAVERMHAARRGFQGELGAAIEQLAASGDAAAAGSAAASTAEPGTAAAAAATVAAAALLEELLPEGGLGASGGVQSAARLYEQVRHRWANLRDCWHLLV